MQDLQGVEKKYTDAGYLQVERRRARRSTPSTTGIIVTVEVDGGRRFKVGKLDFSGDETDRPRRAARRAQAQEGRVFNRSNLTSDVEDPDAHYTDRGFYFAQVEPADETDRGVELTVDVTFDVEQGPLYFVRDVDVTGNTRTVDPRDPPRGAARRGPALLGARDPNSQPRPRHALGFFEEVDFEAKTTDQPDQLDLDVKVVEKPTGSLSLRRRLLVAGHVRVLGHRSRRRTSSAAATACSLVGRHRPRNEPLLRDLLRPVLLRHRVQPRRARFPHRPRVRGLRGDEPGVDLTLGHALNEDGNRARLPPLQLRAARGHRAPHGRERRGDDLPRDSLEDKQHEPARPLVPLRHARRPRRADGGLRVRRQRRRRRARRLLAVRALRGRGAWFMQPPEWLADWLPLRDARPSCSARARLRAAVQHDRRLLEFDVRRRRSATAPGSSEVQPLDKIDTDLKLPLTERYFLGGLGTYQLRGFKARSVGPRRVDPAAHGRVRPRRLLSRRSGAPSRSPSTATARLDCVLRRPRRNAFGNQGNGNGKCNSLNDKKINDFEDLERDRRDRRQQVHHRSPSSTASRSPSRSASSASSSSTWATPSTRRRTSVDVTEWRYGTGVGVLWFSPFGPLQAFVGFPLDTLSVEDSVVVRVLGGRLGSLIGPSALTGFRVAERRARGGEGHAAIERPCVIAGLALPARVGQPPRPRRRSRSGSSTSSQAINATDEGKKAREELEAQAPRGRAAARSR